MSNEIGALGLHPWDLLTLGTHDLHRAYLGQGHANFQKGDIMMPTQEHMMTLSLLWHKRMIMLTCALGPYTQGQSRYLTVLFEVRERWPVCHWAI